VPPVLCNFLSFAIKRRESKGMLKQRLSLPVALGYSRTPRKENGFAYRSIPVQSDKSFEAMPRQLKLA
jgi:hypothetical protein